jgi:hypothetical protein
MWLSRVQLSKLPTAERGHGTDYATMADMCGSSRHKTLSLASTGPGVSNPWSYLNRPSLFVFLEKLIPRNRLLRHLGEFGQEVDHLVLEQRRA